MDEIKYDELVVFKEFQVVPAYIITFQLVEKPKPKEEPPSSNPQPPSPSTPPLAKTQPPAASPPPPATRSENPISFDIPELVVRPTEKKAPRSTPNAIGTSPPPSSNFFFLNFSELETGIDFGTSHCCAAIWTGEEVEIIPNERGNRTTPSVVAFTPTELIVGEAAKNLSPLIFNDVTLFTSFHLLIFSIKDCLQCQETPWKVFGLYEFPS
jgi:hypothetical protein